MTDGLHYTEDSADRVSTAYDVGAIAGSIVFGLISVSFLVNERENMRIND